MSFYLDPSRSNVSVLILYRNFAAAKGRQYSHVGLGVNGLQTAKVLRQNKIKTSVVGVWTVDDARKALAEQPFSTHCLIEAPWISAADTASLMSAYPHIHFIVRSHSQIGFLQVESGAITILRDLLTLQEGSLNLTVAANSLLLKSFIEKVYGSKCLYLPNLYDLERVTAKRGVAHDHRLLRVGSFGAMRLLKNHTTAAAAAMMTAKQRGCNLEFYVSTNRVEHGQGILDSLRAMFVGVPWAKLVESQWQDWSRFRTTVAHMDLCMQLSTTETFNIVTADACAEGVASVVTPVIDWAPKWWQVGTDSVDDAARVAGQLLSSPHAAEEGMVALRKFMGDATQTWLSYLDGQP
jgi:hypothetical protein